jgi:hypothetical protein
MKSSGCRAIGRGASLPATRRDRKGGGFRPLAAFYGLAFLLAASAAPHRHLNAFEDLVSDGPSDSGVFLAGHRSGVGAGEAQIGAAKSIDDDPCLACFHHDYAASLGQLFVLRETVTPLEPIPPLTALTLPQAAAESLSSRSPPNRA